MGTGKKKIEIKKKEKNQDRMVAFSKRRRGLFKKSNQLYQLADAKIAVIVYSPAGKPYIYGDPFLDLVNNYCGGTTRFCSTSTDFCSSTSSVSEADNEEEDKYKEEFEYWKSCLRTMELDVGDNVDHLIFVKNDLDQIKEKLINTIQDLSE